MTFIIAAYCLALCVAVFFLKVAPSWGLSIAKSKQTVFFSFMFFPVMLIGISALASVLNALLGIADMYLVLTTGFYVAVSSFLLVMMRGLKDNLPKHVLVYLSIVIVVTAALTIGFSRLPIFGWDAVDFWTAYAGDFLNYSSQGITEPFDYWNYKHPRTVSYIQILSYGFWPGSELQIPLVAINLLAVALPIYGFLNLWPVQQPKAQLVLVAILAVYSIPLLENHINISGYAEIYIFSLILVCSSLIALSRFFLEPHRVIAVAYISALLLVTLKTLGPYLVALLILAHLIVVVKLTLREGVLVSLAGTSLIFLIYVYGFSFSLAGQTVSLEPSFQSVMMGGWNMQLRINSLKDLVAVVSTGFAANSSFSIWFLISITSFLYVLQTKPAFAKEATWIAAYGFSIMLLISLHVALTKYGLDHALPGSDTAFSRFSLAGFAPTIIVLIMLCSHKPITKAGTYGRV